MDLVSHFCRETLGSQFLERAKNCSCDGYNKVSMSGWFHLRIYITGKCEAFSTYKRLNLQITMVNTTTGDGGDTVVKVLCYKSEGSWFDPSWCHWNFSLT